MKKKLIQIVILAVFLLSDGENVSMMVGNCILDFFKEARLGSMIKIPKLGLGSGSARARLWKLELGSGSKNMGSFHL